jgi:hypothetical protein
MRRIVKRQKTFLAAFKITGRIDSAAKAAGVDRSSHYDWLREVKGYRELFEAAIAEAADALEDEATRRATEGVLEAHYYQGKPVGARRVYSDGLMMFLLRGLKPAKYRDLQSVEVTGKNGGPIENALTVTFVHAKDGRPAD